MTTQRQMPSPWPVSWSVQPPHPRTQLTLPILMDALPHAGMALPSWQSPSLHPHPMLTEGSAWEMTTPFVQRTTQRRSGAQMPGLLPTASSRRPGLSFLDPLSAGLGAADTLPVLSPLGPSFLPNFLPSPPHQFSVPQWEG